VIDGDGIGIGIGIGGIGIGIGDSIDYYALSQNILTLFTTTFIVKTICGWSGVEWSGVQEQAIRLESE
jgi:hypothetical protein